MKQEKQEEEEELEVPSDEIPYTTYPLCHHQQQQQRHRLLQEQVRQQGQQRQQHHGYGYQPLDYGVVREMHVAGDTNDPSLYCGRGVAAGASPLVSGGSVPSSPAAGMPSSMVDDGWFGYSPTLGQEELWGTGELRLRHQLRAMSLRDGRDPAAATAIEAVGNNAATTPGNNQIDPYAVWGSYGNVVSEDLPNDPSLNSIIFDQERSVRLGLQRHCRVGANWLQPSQSSHQQNTPLSYPSSLCSDPANFPHRDDLSSDLQLQGGSVLGRNRYQMATHDGNFLFSTSKTAVIEALLASQQKGVGSNNQWDAFYSPVLPATVPPQRHSGFPMLNRTGTSFNGYTPQSLPSPRIRRGIKAFTGEDSFIIQGKELRCGMNNGREFQRERKRSQLDGRFHSRGTPAPVNMDCLQSSGTCGLSSLPPKYDSLVDIQGCIYFVAKDQHGCRFLQSKYDEGTPEEKEMIFNEIIDHVAELMVNPFGNYLMQKVLEECTKEQRMEILRVLTIDPIELVRISLNTHGTRAVQKLIETLETREETSLVISALQPGFLSLTKDLNGNHVVQRCLECFKYDDNKFIFDAAAKHCVDIASHQHGCCVLQRCIAHSTGEQQTKLAVEVSKNGLHLAQDAFGNYAVQYTLNLKNPLANKIFQSQFKRNYVQLSVQKFSSNVVQKCLNVFDEEGRTNIIAELLSVSHFEQLLQDPYANYVIQSALRVSKGNVRELLANAIQPHDGLLRTNPYSKRIFSLLKK